MQLIATLPVDKPVQSAGKAQQQSAGRAVHPMAAIPPDGRASCGCVSRSRRADPDVSLRILVIHRLFALVVERSAPYRARGEAVQRQREPCHASGVCVRQQGKTPDGEEGGGDVCNMGHQRWHLRE